MNTRNLHPAGVRGYTFGPFRVDLASYQFWRGNDLLAITPKAFDTLIVLIANRNRVVGKDELMSLLWPESFVSEDSLTQSVSVLRRALGDDPNQPQFIATSARHGYRFIAVVQESAADHEPETAAVSPVSPPSSASARTAPAPGVEQPPPAARALRSRVRPMWIAVPAAFAILLTGFVAMRTASVAPEALPGRGPLRFTQEAPVGTALVSGGVLSPDGRYVAFVAQDNRSGTHQLWIRALDAPEPRALPGTDGAARPFWSPDGQRLGFFSSGKLRHVGLDAQPPTAIASTDSTTEGGGSWSAGGVILFTVLRSGLYSVPATGGPVTPATKLDQSTQEVAHRWPQFLPDGRHFLFFVDSVRPDRVGTYLGSLDSPDKVRVIDVPAVYAQDNYLVYIRDRGLTAQRFDVGQARLVGPPTAVAGNAVTPTTTNGAVVSAADKLMAFGVSRATEQFEWFSRSGQRMGSIDTPTALRNPAVSPDSRQLLAASNTDPEHKGLWIIDLERGGLTRIASDGMRPFWSPDGQRIAFTSDRSAGVADLYTRSTSARDGEEQALLRTAENKFICDWSPDGRYIVYDSVNAGTKSDLWLLPLLGDRTPMPYLVTPNNELDAQISPDGRWIAYTSDESGSWEVYVQSFPVAGRKQIVSTAGGIEPRWRHDGRELFYLATDRNLMSVDIKADADAIRSGRPQALFRAAVPSLNVFINWYAVTADGQRFVINTAAGKGNEQPITVLVNWSAGLKP
jgi:Tol biopolymer transport system component/DNA-binding winged helix-turn-helix (wHTH) protein